MAQDIETIAIKAALSNPIQKLPRMAAVLITPEGDIFVGRNQYKTHPLQARFSRNSMSIYLHAEIDALVKAIRNIGELDHQKSTYSLLNGSSMFVARVLRNGCTALAEPCSGCLGALLHFGIEDVKWTT